MGTQGTISTYVGQPRLASSRLLGVFLRVVFGVMPIFAVIMAQAQTPEQEIIARLHPYSEGAPQVSGLEPGVTLDQASATLEKEVLPEEILKLLSAGDFTVTVQKTTDLALRQSYIDATLKHAHEVSPNGSGALLKYQGGVPFPLLDPADP